MTKFRSRLLFALITLIFAVLIGLGLLLGQLYKSYYLNAFDERLKKETKMISSYVEDEGGILALKSESIDTFSKVLNARVTIVDISGVIVYDSKPLNDASSNNEHHAVIKSMIKKDAAGHHLVEVDDGYDLHYYWRPIVQSGADEGFVLLSTKMTEINKAYQQIWWILIICLGFAFIVILLLGTRITNRYTKPIEAATKTAIELAKGNYRARTYEDQIDETGMLSASINILARNLQEMRKLQEMHQDRLAALIENMGSGLILIDKKGYISLINRPYKELFRVNDSEYTNKLYYEVIQQQEVTSIIEELFMTEQKVRKQIFIPLSHGRQHFEIYGVPIIGTNDVWRGILLVFHDISDIKKLEQVRKDFVANVSHELKTPITSIKGFSETLLDGAMEDKQALEAFLKIILQESDRLQSLVQDLLDLSKMEQLGFHLSIQQFNIRTTLEEVIAILNKKADEKEIKLQFEADKKSILIDGDADRLKQVFLNLVSNAISYTPNCGHVFLGLKESASNIFVEVKDTGIGMEESEVPRIFERFYRIDKARSRNSGGTGLGLAIVKHIVEAHKGNIIVTSQVGKGTTFLVELNKQFLDE
ncbi:two-component system histidine kinase PnpS [Cytobacillus solani]|uniref:histidine kinase n=1 Tax=Cytobacillus solani TaxID=1637975 RepID=A0A0Q3VJB4_9BACI|nr:ATP-binding protein [Cytobacillus solani]KQL20783.1 alkaline phosphatase [Cytobacillus solani]USK54021.1 PAS domain-containing protein [Cytobacillus solani]